MDSAFFLVLNCFCVLFAIFWGSKIPIMVISFFATYLKIIVQYKSMIENKLTSGIVEKDVTANGHLVIAD